MNKYELPEFQISADTLGVQIQPSEKGNLLLHSDYQQFFNQCERMYSSQSILALEDEYGYKVTVHPSYSQTFIPLFFHVHVFCRHKQQEFLDPSQQKDLTDNLLASLAQNAAISPPELFPKRSGNRAVFATDFIKENNPTHGEGFTSHILISTTVFYNDYRMTLNFPSTKEETREVTKSLFQFLCQNFPDFQFLLT